MNDELLVDIWVGLKEYFDKKQLEIVAAKYIDILADNNVYDTTLKLMRGNDEDLDEAIEYYLDGPSDEDNDDYDFEE